MKRMFCWLAVAALTVAMVGCESKKAAETAEFETAADAVKKMTAGWNLGNTLDAFSTDVAPGSPTDAYETCWGEPVAEEYLIKQFKDKGFDVVRVPVTWWQHMDEEGTVDSVWMARVETVVNYVLDNGMYCIVNVHHDTGAHADSWIKADSANYEANHERFKKLWTQIAVHFRDYGEKLLFEGYNEMLTGTTPDAEWAEPKNLANLEVVNKYAQDFVTTVRATGGNNEFRNLIVNTYSGAHTPNTLAGFRVPTDPNGNQNHLAVEVHSYDPWDWVNTENMTWTERCSKEIANMFEALDTTFIQKGYPVILGEYGSNGEQEKTINATCTDAQKQEAGRQAADMTRLCKQYGASGIYWMGIVEFNDRKQASFKWTLEQVADSIVANK